MLVGQFLEHVLASGILPGLGFLGFLVDFQTFEKNFA